MNDERWEQFIELARQKFRGVKVSTEDLVVSTQDGLQKQGTQDILVFDKGDDRFKLVRENRPVVLEKKMHYSHRQGDTAQTEYKFSDTEFSHKLRVYRETDIDEWEEIDARVPLGF